MKSHRKLLLLVAALMLAAPAAPAQTEQSARVQRRVDRQIKRSVSRSLRGKRKSIRTVRGSRSRGNRMSRLNLTEGQKQQIDQLQKDFLERTGDLRTQLGTKRAELRRIRDAEQFNEPLALQKLTEIAQLEARLMGEESRHRQAVRSTLTEEQKKVESKK
ncbi:MAG: hypothetical protein IPM66_03355 [Acidobacteriota bacterium]|nr:MAG: hypothetical protein IPM66_03355 [Acidobacteriota bacterium]